MKRNIVLLTLLFSWLMGSSFIPPEEKPEKPKNIILMIGDGMGLSQMSAAYYYGEKEPNFSRFTVIGLSKTSSCSDKITDSAAGATALATGEKTYNGAIGLDMDKDEVETLVEYFAKEGKSTGIVATSSITHATPASFYAHQRSRNSQSRIARQLLTAPLDFFAAGGRKFFNIGEGSDDYVEALSARGFLMNINELDKKLPKSEKTKYGYLLAEDGMPKMIEGRGDFLKQASMLGIDALSKNENGFFLMIEGSQIDWGGHARNAQYVITEVLDFDDALGAILDFAKKDGETLVIVTADHETGGFTLSSEQKKVPFMGVQSDYNSIAPTFSTSGHSAALVPVLAYGPGAEEFAGIYEITEIHKKILKLVN